MNAFYQRKTMKRDFLGWKTGERNNGNNTEQQSRINYTQYEDIFFQFYKKKDC